VNRAGGWSSFLAGVIVALPLVLAGCGGSGPAPTKTADQLSEEEKQQLRDLNEQRAQEWGGKK